MLQRISRNPHNRSGMKVIELMVVVAVIGIVLTIATYALYAYIGKQAFDYGTSTASVSKIQAIEAVEDMGFTDVQLLEEFRMNPQDDVGCQPADTAGFKLTGVNEQGSTEKIDLCCIGAVGDTPRCRQAN